MSDLEFIKDIDNYLDYFSSDHQLIIKLIGIDNYLKLAEHFGKTGIYFGNSSINQLKKMWAIKNKNIDYNEAARALDVSTKTIYNWRQEAHTDNMDLFEDREEE